MRGDNLVLFVLVLADLSRPARSQDSKILPSGKTSLPSKEDFNRDIFYRNKLEFSYEVGWLPFNIPLIYDVFLGSPYTTWPLKYTLVPNISFSPVAGGWYPWPVDFTGEYGFYIQRILHCDSERGGNAVRGLRLRHPA